MKVLIINGPNLNLLGRRDPAIYGTETLDEIMADLEAYLNENACEAEFFQSNHEGAIIDRIHAAIGRTDGIIINAGAYTHYSYAIRDAIEAAGIPTVEVHLSDIHARESFRAISVIEPVCIAQVSALGRQSYFVGAEILLAKLRSGERARCAQNKKTYAVIGDPVEHSRSPELYAPMFEKANIDADFLRLKVTREEFPRIREIAAEHALDGFAVTMPHKAEILKYADEADGSALACGCGNIVTVCGGVLRVYNTDGEGMLNALREAGVSPKKGMNAVILGEGGAAKAAAAALRGEGCAVRHVARRHEPGPDRTLRDDFLDLRKLENCIAIAERITGCMSFADIVINATPLGMEGREDFADLSFIKMLKSTCTVFDFVYHKDGSDTSLIKAAKEAGLKTVGGERLLYHQGLLAFKLWTGIDPAE